MELRNWKFLGMRRVYEIYWLPFARLHEIFLAKTWAQDHDFKEFRGFPGMELGMFRVVKSSGNLGPSLRPCAHSMMGRGPFLGCGLLPPQ